MPRRTQSLLGELVEGSWEEIQNYNHAEFFDFAAGTIDDLTEEEAWDYWEGVGLTPHADNEHDLDWEETKDLVGVWEYE